MADELQLTVTGMTCGGCEAAVSRALQKLPGVDRVSASHVAKRVEVGFDAARISAATIKDRIAALGYVVEG